MPVEGRGKAQTAGSFAGATAAGVLSALAPAAPFISCGASFVISAGQTRSRAWGVTLWR